MEAKSFLGRHRVLKLPHRHTIIDSFMVSCFFVVPNGKYKIRIGVQPEMVGHRFGEFVRTRRKTQHYRKKRQKAMEKRKKEEAKKAGKGKVVDLAKIAALRQKRKSRKL